ncbi:hypothetical protein H7I87_05105 [Mycobacterium timonense]|uniref:Transposase n=1 Tax=Mycobacterium bouchedurhonense TaxID=701041 RepID=A0AAW5SD32_MYCBC|nr:MULTISPECIES: hypothetical protein [Mycobacterium avium complex (MAC)]MCV6993139.1 hypothetical protein [Mycobacterium bouchedurhonense]MCV6994105.1 hypothetical protein [Mycobacterium timonense]
MLELEEIDPSDDDLVATEIAERHAVIDRLHGEIQQLELAALKTALQRG